MSLDNRKTDNEPHKLDYQKPPLPKPPKQAAGVWQILFGIVLFGWGGVGSLFVYGDPHVEQIGVYVLVIVACGGIAMIIYGLRKQLR